MAPKRTYAHKWNVDILEQVAYACNIASNSQNDQDWELFLSAVYDAIGVLSYDQRIVLLLSQEVGISFVDIARILGKPISTIIGLLKVAINKVSFYIKARSLTHKGVFDCKALQSIYDEQFNPEEYANGSADFEFLERYSAPYYSPRNFLIESLDSADCAVDGGV